MTEQEIRSIVNIVLDEIEKRAQVTYRDILKVMDSRLYSYFQNYDDEELCTSLNKLVNDSYYNIILYQYSKRHTMEHIAELMDKEVSTIKRNKKRLLTKLYKILY